MTALSFRLVLLLAAAALPAGGQTPPDGAVEVVSVSVNEEMSDLSGGIWRPAAPENHEALVLRVRVTRGSGYDTTDLTLAFGPGGKSRAVCAGVTARMPDGWVINEAGMKWSFYPGGTGTLDGLGVLFVIPRGLAEATLHYKGKPAGAAFAITRP